MSIHTWWEARQRERHLRQRERLFWRLEDAKDERAKWGWSDTPSEADRRNKHIERLERELEQLS